MSNAKLNKAIREAARLVVSRWEKGNLAGAVQGLDCALDDWKERATFKPRAPATGDVIHGRDSLVHPHSSDTARNLEAFNNPAGGAFKEQSPALAFVRRFVDVFPEVNRDCPLNGGDAIERIGNLYEDATAIIKGAGTQPDPRAAALVQDAAEAVEQFGDDALEQAAPHAAEFDMDDLSEAMEEARLLLKGDG